MEELRKRSFNDIIYFIRKGDSMKVKKVCRDIDVDVLLEIIRKREEYKENSQNGLVILLNGSWGSGKSTFLKQLEEKIIECDDVQLFINYNAYEYDFYETPYIPFFSSIEDKLKLGKDLEKIIKLTGKNFGKGILVSLYAMINGIYKKNFDIDLNDVKDNILGIDNESYKKDFDDFILCKKNIKVKLKESCSKKPQIFIVDELDRCKPSFAIDTLEIIKHFFDVENCIFIVAVDKLQLEESAKTIFGQEMDSEKYFSKFFDYQYNLLPIKFYETVDTSDIYNLDKIVKEISEMFQILNISLRDANKIFNEFVSKYKIYNNGEILEEKKWTEQQCYIVTFLLTLKYTDLLFYTELMNGNYNKYITKIKDDVSGASNNYYKLLNRKIDDKYTYSSFLTKLTSYLENEYFDVDKAYGTYWPYEHEDNEFTRKQERAREMHHYIPQVEPNKTFKENIQKIIN